MNRDVHPDRSGRAWLAGSATLLLIIFGVPAWLVPTAMDNIPDRSMTRVIGVHQEAAEVISTTFARHADPAPPGRLMPLPRNTTEWIERINPMGRKAPGGGLAILPIANDETGAIGLRGDAQAVVLTLPAYRQIESKDTTIRADHLEEAR